MTIDDVIERASARIAATQRADGAWEAPDDLGPINTAWCALALMFMDELDSPQRERAAAYLVGAQLADGSYPIAPFGKTGSITATAAAWAVLDEVMPTSDATFKARLWMDANGGLDAVVAALDEADMTAFYLAMVGKLPADRLPNPPAWAFLNRLTEWYMRRRLNPGLVIVVCEQSALTSYLRAGRPTMSSCLRNAMLEVFDLWQNKDGGWNSNSAQTSLAVAALKAMGVDPDDDRIVRAVAFLKRMAIPNEDETTEWYNAFGSNIWTTAFALRALLRSGTPAHDDVVVNGVKFLLESEIKTRQPAELHQPGKPWSGGWAFQVENTTMADNDDTGIVLEVLALARHAEGVDPAYLRDIDEAVEKGKAWLLGMQNPDGGWAAFTWGMPSKPPGPFWTQPVKMPDGLLEILEFALWPPVELGEPSTEDVTARCLFGLGALGDRVGNRSVDLAVDFLKFQQWDGGPWWGRWVVNYLPTTAYALMGLREVDVDLSEDWVQGAIQWILSRQRDDGGWGESSDCYRDPALAGLASRSMAPLTGLIVTALVSVGLGESEAVAKAVDYLVASFDETIGSWPGDEWLVTYIPPDTFYSYGGANGSLPLEGLGVYRASLSESS